LLKLLEENERYEKLKDGYTKVIENEEGSEILNTIEKIDICGATFGDMGAKILGLGLLENTKLLYLELGIFLKQ